MAWLPPPSLFLGRSMRSYTLDTNCLIDLEENRPAAHGLRQLVSAFQNGAIDLAVPAIMASENQRDGTLIENFSEFRRRIASLELADATLLQPLAYFDVTFFGHSLYTDDDATELERRIHEVIHPEIKFAANEAPSKKKWRNAKCDVLAIWSHIHNHRECFVTSDTDFLNKVPALVQLGAGDVLTPEQAAATVSVHNKQGD